MNEKCDKTEPYHWAVAAHLEQNAISLGLGKLQLTGNMFPVEKRDKCIEADCAARGNKYNIHRWEDCGKLKGATKKDWWHFRGLCVPPDQL